ncbi:hypothetical protein [Nocardia rhamnosiphila]
MIEVQSHEEAAGLLRKDDRVVVEADPKYVRVLPGEVPTPGEES